MAVTGFNHYNLRAPRALLDELRDFYCQIVGLSEGERPAFRTFGYWLYAGGTDVLHLSECSADEARQTFIATTFDHAAFTCDDADAMETHLKAQGIEYILRFVSQTNIKQIFFRDPAGNGVELNCAL